MIIRILLIHSLLFFAVLGYSQNTKELYGRVRISTSMLYESTDAISAFLICGKDTLSEDNRIGGKFFWNKVPVGVAICKVWADGYITITDTITVRSNKLSEKDFTLTDRVIELKGVIVKGNIPAVVYKGDTIRFNPQGVQVMEGDLARNILEQMPGVEVKENSVTVGGEDVKKTYVDGKKIFGDNPMAALNHLPADDVLYISAYDEDEFKGQKDKFKKGKKQRVLNVETKSKLVNSTEGDAFASAGGNLNNEQQAAHKFRYGAGGTFNFFSEKLLFSVDLLHNNMNRGTNQLRYYQSLQEPPRVYSENTYTGFSLSRTWEKSPTVYKNLDVSYNYSRKCSELNSELTQNYFPTFAFQERIYSTNTQNESRKNKHAMSVSFAMADEKWGRLSYKHDLWREDEHTHYNQFVNDDTDGVQTGGLLHIDSSGKEFFISEHLSWNKYWGMWNTMVDAQYSNRKSDDYEQREDSLSSVTESNLTRLDINSTDRGEVWGFSSSVGRALSKESVNHIRLGYSFSSDRNRPDRQAWDLSNVSGYSVIDATNTYNYKNKKSIHQLFASFDGKVGGLYLHGRIGWSEATVSRIEGEQENQRENYAKKFHLPDASVGLSYRVKRSVYQLDYGLSTRLPLSDELRPWVDNRNPYFLRSGNSQLKQADIHQFKLNYYNDFTGNGHTLSSDMTLRFVKNNIVSRTTYFKTNTLLPELNYEAQAGSTLYSYDNINGTWGLNWYTNWNAPLSKIKSMLGGVLVYTHNQDPYYFNSIRDQTRSDVIGGYLNFLFNKVKGLRVRITTGSNYAVFGNKQTSLTNKVFTQSAGVNFYCKPILKYFFADMSYKFQFQRNFSYATDINRTHMLNAYVGCKLFKRQAELSFTAYDLLNSYNPNLISVNMNYVNSIRNENFGRYFTFNFSWSFRKIKSNRVDISRGISM